MTAKDAKTKWCPMARATVQDFPSSNRDFSVYGPDMKTNNNPEYARCIADECACWVWVRKITMGPDHNKVTTLPDDEWQGRCGLAR